MRKIKYDSAGGPLRVLAVCSGPGQAVWAALDLQKELKAKSGHSPFEVVGLFSDRPAGAALEEAVRRSLPTFILDSSGYHHGQPREQMSAEDIVVFEKAMIELVSGARADCLLVDGYQWTIGSNLLEEFLAVRIWPAGPLCLKRFLRTGESILRARVTWLTAPGGLGPVIVTAPPVDIDYGKFVDEKSGVSLYLKQVMGQSGRAGARAVLEMGRGDLSLDDDGAPCYKGGSAPQGLILDSWD